MHYRYHTQLDTDANASKRTWSGGQTDFQRAWLSLLRRSGALHHNLTLINAALARPSELSLVGAPARTRNMVIMGDCQQSMAMKQWMILLRIHNI